MTARVIRGVLLLAAATGAWLALLWFVLAPDFTRLAPASLLALHGLPPLLAAGTWWGWRHVRRVRRQRAEDARRKALEAERQAALAAAREAHQQALRARRFGCDCRGLVWAGGEALRNVIPDVYGVARLAVPSAGADTWQLLLEHALRWMFTWAPDAIGLPVHVVPPRAVGGETIIAQLAQARARVAGELGLTLDEAGAPMRFLPAGDSAADSVIALFEAAPDSPGAVVLAVDALPPGPDPETAQAGVNQPLLMALLVTHPELATLKTAPGSMAGEEDPFVPFWVRHPVGNDEAVAPEAALPSQPLARLPVLARIRRAAVASEPVARERMLRLSQRLQQMLEEAQINAGLIEPPFAHDGTPAAASAHVSGPWGWLVHNAGRVEEAGTRLAALGAALAHFGVDLHPIDEATNWNDCVGLTARAGSMGMLAVTVARAAAQRLPALCAEFGDEGGVALSLALPAQEEET